MDVCYQLAQSSISEREEWGGAGAVVTGSGCVLSTSTEISEREEWGGAGAVVTGNGCVNECVCCCVQKKCRKG